MREILFRGKRIDSGEFEFGNLSIHKTGKAFIKSGSAVHSFEVDPATVGQYTGLTDKNGVKIFEGDFLLIRDSQQPVLVRFINFSWECTSEAIGPYYRHRLEGESSKYEIISNIHDNPEFLNEA